MSEQIKNFSAIIFGAICLAIGFMMFGWWILLPMFIGIAWQVAGQAATRRKHQQQPPYPSCVASTPSKPASTVTWQETVAAIERERKSDAHGAVKSNH